MLKTRESENQSNELIIQHFILGLIIFLEALIKIINLTLPKPRKKIKSIKVFSKENHMFTSMEYEQYYSFISEQSNKDLKKILGNIDIFSKLSKKKLTDLIMSNDEALKLMKIQRKREFLSKMTNQEIRTLLKGVAGLSRLKKSQLVEMVIKLDN